MKRKILFFILVSTAIVASATAAKEFVISGTEYKENKQEATSNVFGPSADVKAIVGDNAGGEIVDLSKSNQVFTNHNPMGGSEPLLAAGDDDDMEDGGGFPPSEGVPVGSGEFFLLAMAVGYAILRRSKFVA